MNRVHINFCLWTALSAFVAGCTTIEPFDGVKRAPKDRVEVFAEGKQPTKEYSIIATFAERDGAEREEHWHQNFVKRAKALGADGLIIKPVESGGSSYGPLGGGTKAMFRGVAFVWK